MPSSCLTQCLESVIFIENGWGMCNIAVVKLDLLGRTKTSVMRVNLSEASVCANSTRSGVHKHLSVLSLSSKCRQTFALFRETS